MTMRKRLTGTKAAKHVRGWWRFAHRAGADRPSSGRGCGRDPKAATGLFDLDVNCCATGYADRVAFLFVGAAYYRAFMQAARKARRR